MSAPTATSSRPAPPTGSKPSRAPILDLNQYLDQEIRVKFTGGRELTGILKGYDPLVNLVLDNAVEHIRDLDDPYKLTDQTRSIGLVVCRGTTVMLLCPTDGMQEIENPFIQQEQSEQAI